MNLYIQSIKKALAAKMTLVAMLMLAQASAAVAAATGDITIGDLEMGIGETKTIEVQLTSSELMVNPMFDVTLPAGLTFVDASQAKGSLLGRSHSLAVAKQASGAYRFTITSTINAAVAATEGVLVTFDVTATAKIDDGVITVSNKTLVLASDHSQQLNPADTESSVKVTVSMDGDASVSVSATSVDVAEGTPFAVEFLMDNTATIVGLQADLTLPEGVKLVETADGNIGYTDRIPDAMTIGATKNGTKYTIMMSSLVNTPVVGTSGTLFVLNMVADENLAATADVVLSNIIVSCKNGAGKYFDDTFTITLTNTTKRDAEELAANKAAFAEYQAAQKAAVEALAKEDDSEAAKQIIADAAAAIAALEYDEAKTLDENKGAVDAVATKAGEDLDAQRAADEAAAKKAVNEEAYTTLKAQYTALRDALKEAKSKVKTDCADVAANFDEAFSDIDALLNEANAKLEAEYVAEKLTAESELQNAEAITAAIAKVLEDAAAAQQAYDEQKAAEAANEAAYTTLKAELDALTSAITAAKADVEKEAPSVKDEYLAQLDKMQQQVNTAAAALETAYKAGELTAESTNGTLPTAKEIEAVVAAAKDAQNKTVVPGDIKGDGKVDVTDVDTFIEMLSSGTLPNLSKDDPEFKRYDVNGDGVLNIADAQGILNLSLGLNWDGSEPEN